MKKNGEQKNIQPKKQDVEELKKKWMKIIAKAWTDPKFFKKLKEHTNQTLHDEGIEVAKGKNIKIIEENNDEIHIVIPFKHEGKITDVDLKRVSGGLVVENKIVKDNLGGDPRTWSPKSNS